MTEPTRTLATSPDGQWTAAREDRQLTLFQGVSSQVGHLELATNDVDVALVGPPAALVVLTREGSGGSIVLYTTPYLEGAARVDLDSPARVVAMTGPRLAVMSPDGKGFAIVRTAGRALSTQKIDVGGVIEFVVGLERNQLLVGMAKKLEVWDAVSGRPLLRAQFQLPPPPRMLGSAAGHLWAATTGSEEVFLYRLSDGRPFRHYAGAPIVDVICHPASPVVVLVTPRGLLRLHAYAHSLTLIDGVPDRPGAMALHAVGEDISVIGFTGNEAPFWRVPINGSGAAAPAAVTVAAPGGETSVGTAPVRTAPGHRGWREPLVGFGGELSRGTEIEAPVVAIDNELGDLAHRLQLGGAARRALTALYALHLVGEPAVPIATLAKAINDWSEPLGQGELGALAMLRRKHGRVALRTAVTDLLDGAPPRSVRLAGGSATIPRAGAFRVSRDSRTDAEIEAELVTQLGRIAVIEAFGSGSLRAGLLEARLHGATAVVFGAAPDKPRPWPRDAGLVLVLYGTTASWVADLPTLAPPTAS